MSYILDALKKSEEERRRGELPGLQTYTPIPTAEGKKNSLLIVVGVLVVVNAAVIVLWQPWQTDDVNTTAVNSQGVVPKEATQELSQIPNNISTPAREVPVNATIQQKPKLASQPMPSSPAQPATPVLAPAKVSQPQSATVKADVTVRKPVQPKPQNAIVRAPTSAYLPQLSELPHDIQSQIPDMVFSSHMFSSQERFRSITINGRRLKEGKFYNEDLYVNEITDKGAVLGFEGTLFEVDVLGQWGE